MPSRHYLVAGRVQGVCYRASARAEATRLGLSGWVRNLRDGRVEALASGEADALAAFERWLASGPPHAQVTQVMANDSPEDAGDGFVVR